MNVYQVKNVINNTECADFIYSSGYCSEPIMSKDDNGELIDNYLTYSRNNDCTMISAPSSTFGIYTDKEQVAYMDTAVSDKFQEPLYEEYFEDDEMMREKRQVYLELYPHIRDMYQTESNINAEKIADYIEALRIISGNTLFSYYKKLFPDFFEWAAKVN